MSSSSDRDHGTAARSPGACSERRPSAAVQPQRHPVGAHVPVPHQNQLRASHGQPCVGGGRVLAAVVLDLEIGRSSCRERVKISVGAVSLKKKSRNKNREHARNKELMSGRTAASDI